MEQPIATHKIETTQIPGTDLKPAEIDKNSVDTIKQPVGPEFMAPPEQVAT